MKSFYLTLGRTLMLALFAFALLNLSACDDDDHDHDHDDEHFEAVGLVLYENGTEVLRLENNVITGDVALVLGAQGRTFELDFILEDGDVSKPDDDDDLTLQIELEDASIIESFDVNSETFTFGLRGLTEGTSGFTISLDHEGHSDYVSLVLPISVTM